MRSGGVFDYDQKNSRFSELEQLLADPAIWQDVEKVKLLTKEKTQLENSLDKLNKLQQELASVIELHELAQAESEPELLSELSQDVLKIEKILAELEFQRKFAGESDSCSAFVDIQAGSGGTEAQDWAQMLARMYSRFAENHGFKVKLLEQSLGEVAGIKSSTLLVTGEYAYGWLKSETGIHRLVRKSPFDSGNRRHTSFAAIFVYPEIDANCEVDINPADLRIDTYRSSGAGGQHVNTTDSAVRVTHVPTGIVVQCQNDRSQHKNKAQALKQLQAKLRQLELQQKNKEKQQLEDAKLDIGWGSQIRSYVLDQSRIKDHRTNFENSNPTAVLDGDLDEFIEATLMEGWGEY